VAVIGKLRRNRQTAEEEEEEEKKPISRELPAELAALKREEKEGGCSSAN
jgi:hypothetical protein